MRVLIIGASGLIGSTVAARLAARGDEITAVGRGAFHAGLVPATWVVLDVARAETVQHWLPHLAGIDAVVNCAGVLQDAPGDSTAGVHANGVAALFKACEQAGVRRVVHLSAVGVDRETPTAFSRSKLAGDQALMERDLDWVILRPSVVVGRPAYGGSALFRGLAALPLVPMTSGTAPLQIVHLDDLAQTVEFFLQPGAPARRAIEIVGPRRWSFDDIVRLFRKWLRLPPARNIVLPKWAAALTYRIGDWIALLGWRPPVRSTAGREIERGAFGDPGPWMQLTGIRPRDLEAALAEQPASVQERWFARLYFLKPVVFIVFSLFWIATALISLGPGYAIGKSLMEEGGAGALAGPSVVAGALADLLIGIGIAIRKTARAALYAALGISVFYAAAGTLLVPRLWIDPLGPMLKIWPIIVLNLVALAILDDR